MRVTSNTYPMMLKLQLQTLQQNQLVLQNQISTGLKFQSASGDPTSYAQALETINEQGARNAYIKSTAKAIDTGTVNSSTMGSLQKLINRASELAIKGQNSSYSADELVNIGAEMNGILDQIVSLANTQSGGNYLYGSTGNVIPVVQTGTSVVGTTTIHTYQYNTAAAYNGSVTTAEIGKSNRVETGLTAGRSTGTAFSGFLTDGTTGTDIIQTLTDARDQLLAGTALTTATSTAITDGVNHVSRYVGLSAARLSTLDIVKNNLNSGVLSGKTLLSSQTDVSTTDALTDLQSVQLHYQAALQSGSNILKLSLLNYL